MCEEILKEHESRKDALQRMHQLLTLLARRIEALQEMREKQSMRPGECEQAIDRHIVLTLRILQMRQQFAQAEQKAERPHLLDDLLAEEGEGRIVY